MTYKGYTGVIEVDEEAGELYGRVVGLGRDGISFVGQTIEEARACFEKSVDFYLEHCAATGKEPERPFSGILTVRVAPETQRELARVAGLRGVSPEQLAGERLD